MALLLVQHGKSLSKEIDPERQLSTAGINEVETIAGLAAEYKVQPTQILHSGKTRALQTAEIFEAALQPVRGIKEISGITPNDDVHAYARDINNDSNIMVVGHLPFLERLTSFLIIGKESNVILKFQNGGIVCLDQDIDTKSWFVKWTLMPNVEL